MIQGKDISVAYRRHPPVVKHMNLNVHEGEWLMLCGPNGAGKSTLIRALSGAIPYSGDITILGRNLQSYRPWELAQVLGVLSQTSHITYAYTVNEIVALGTYARHHSPLQRPSPEEKQKIESALAATGMLALRNHNILELSGGEVQRTFLAQVLAQAPALLLLDEPANHLDLLYQKQIFDVIQQWLQEPGRAVVSVVHDLGLARRYGTHCILMHQGQSAASGPIQNVLTRDILNQVYQMDVYQWMQTGAELWQENA